ncbi:mycofactocin dehydrogenase MftG [Nocardia callitridis]|uniref:Mycofactocin system GMC family oxidoreductase MftG n=1 Tax=Nocardia callitridis TaxID=648753 RepID=A0ABP9JWM2_9NOCA
MTRTLIVGAGSAGCVLAARLSEDAEHEVVVLEAGPVWSGRARIPAPLLDATGLPVESRSPWNRQYATTLAEVAGGEVADGAEVDAERATEAVRGVVGGLVRGSVLGGSGAINGGYFVRATESDHAAWRAELGGSPTWSWHSVLPHYRRVERDLDFGDRSWHGGDGPIPVRRTANPVALSGAFASACVALGFPEVADLNPASGHGVSEGVGPVPCNVVDDVRVSTALSHLLPAMSRPNLTVAGATSVTRVRFAGTRAVGVDFERAGHTGTAFADRVVVCAGAVESAALLLRSGVGPVAQLRALGIAVVCSAQVGVGFTDHPEIGIDYRLAGPMQRSVVLEYVLERDDVEFRPYTVSFAPGLRRLGVGLMRPESTGMLRLRSADPAVAPVLEHRYLADEGDRGRLRSAVGLARGVVDAMAGSWASDPVPVRSSAADRWLRANLSTSQHLSGTCRMGTEDDERAVVDEYCRVRGISGLSIVDGSIFPVPLSRGPFATTVMVAERAAVGVREQGW